MGRSCFAGGRSSDLGIHSRASLHVLLENLGDGVGHAGGDGLARARWSIIEHLAARIRDFGYDRRLKMCTLVGQGAVGGSHFEWSNPVGETAKDNGGIGV